MPPSLKDKRIHASSQIPLHISNQHFRFVQTVITIHANRYKPDFDDFFKKQDLLLLCTQKRIQQSLLNYYETT